MTRKLSPAVLVFGILAGVCMTGVLVFTGPDYAENQRIYCDQLEGYNPNGATMQERYPKGTAAAYCNDENSLHEWYLDMDDNTVLLTIGSAVGFVLFSVLSFTCYQVINRKYPDYIRDY